MVRGASLELVGILIEMYVILIEMCVILIEMYSVGAAGESVVKSRRGTWFAPAQAPTSAQAAAVVFTDQDQPLRHFERPLKAIKRLVN